MVYPGSFLLWDYGGISIVQGCMSSFLPGAQLGVQSMQLTQVLHESIHLSYIVALGNAKESQKRLLKLRRTCELLKT